MFHDSLTNHAPNKMTQTQKKSKYSCLKKDLVGNTENNVRLIGPNKPAYCSLAPTPRTAAI